VSSSNIETRSTEGILTLLQLPGVGPRTAAQLIEEFATLEGIHQAFESRHLRSISPRAAKSLCDPKAWLAATDGARQILDRSESLSVRILTAFDEGYPALLRSVRDRPLILYVKGHLRTGSRNVAFIGTREPSRYGTSVTRRLVGLLVEHQWGIVSGLARGVDAESHRAALINGGHTVVVLANGLDRVQPAEHRRLAEEILERGGALVSEQPFGVAARPFNLVQGCRIQSGMSVATLVMQTDLTGGSMQTVRFTLMQGRLLVAPVPRGKLGAEPKSEGLIALTELTGAKLAELLKVNTDYRQALLSRFADRAPAFPVRSRADYPDLLRYLCQRHTAIEQPAMSSIPEHLQAYAAAPKSLQDEANPEAH
jgi:DNA processing protein